MDSENMSQMSADMSAADTSKIVDIFQQSYDHEHEPTGSQHLTFSLGEELYAVDILCVQEIRAWEEVTRIPNTPAYIKGVINLRGSILPVVDLRQYFDLDKVNYFETTVVIVITINVGDRDIQVGIVVDMVSDVIRFTEEEINEPPAFGDDKKSDFITGLVTASISENVINFMDVMDAAENDGKECDDDSVNKKTVASSTHKKAKAGSAKECMVMLLDTRSIGELIVGEKNQTVI